MATTKSKMWYESSTIWLNIAGVLIIVLQMLLQTHFIIDPDVQAIILSVLNILNRFRTSKPVERGLI